MAADGMILCGASFDFGSDDAALAKLLDIRGIGVMRSALPSAHQGMTTDATSGVKWTEFLFSCIATVKPFVISVVFDGNFNWQTILKNVQALTLTWPVQDGYTTGATLGWEKAGVVDYEIGGTFESRPIVNITIQPSGKPTITAGTPVA